MDKSRLLVFVSLKEIEGVSNEVSKATRYTGRELADYLYYELGRLGCKIKDTGVEVDVIELFSEVMKVGISHEIIDRGSRKIVSLLDGTDYSANPDEGTLKLSSKPVIN